MSRRPLDLSVYLVAGEADVGARVLVDVVGAALDGGITLFQLRDKEAGPQRFVELGRALKPLLAAAGVPLIVNDRLEEAVAIGADGVHVGQQDLPAERVRARLGPAAIVGLSAHRPVEAAGASAALVDYLGVGPVHPTGSKADAQSPLGPAGLAAVCRASPLPVVAIGGLNAARAPAAIAAGAEGVAVVSAICGAADPATAARRLAAAVAAAKRARR